MQGIIERYMKSTRGSLQAQADQTMQTQSLVCAQEIFSYIYTHTCMYVCMYACMHAAFLITSIALDLSLNPTVPVRKKKVSREELFFKNMNTLLKKRIS